MCDVTAKTECFVCDGTEPNYRAQRCEKHDVCVHCGTHRSKITEIPWGHHEGFLCQPCDRANKAAARAGYDSSEHDDTEERDSIKCPTCGDEYHPEMEDYRGDGETYETDCPNCDSPMMVTTHYTVEWSTALVSKGGA